MDSLIQIIRSVWKKDRPSSGTSGVGNTPAKLSEVREERLKTVCRRLGYGFRDISLLDRALTHRSFVNHLSPGSRRGRQDYENLEFLGDAVLGLFISEYLLLAFPEQAEGRLTKMRAYLVSTERLHQLSRQLGLGDYIQVSPGEEKTGGRDKRTILADLFEAVVAAIYLDGGVEPARDFVFAQFAPLLEALERGEVTLQDFKSELQELLHSMGYSEPQYRVVAEKGPDHQKEFQVEVYVDGKSVSAGKGRSKKQAEQRAAQKALRRIGEDWPEES